MKVPSVKTVATIAIVGVTGYAAYLLYQFFFKGTKPSDLFKGTVQWWEGLFGQLPPGTRVSDVTGDSGKQAEQTAYNAIINNHSQGFYMAALQQFSFDAGNNVSFDSQGTPGWPWHSYDEWVSLQYPALPSAGSVTVDSDGVFHNDYV